MIKTTATTTLALLMLLAVPAFGATGDGQPVKRLPQRPNVSVVPNQPRIESANTLPAAQPKFQLEAQVNERPQLSRSEIDNSAMRMAPALAVPTTAAAPQRQTLSYAATPRSGPPAADVALAASKAQADEAKAMLREANVDWSRWISQLADRWYYVLRHNEESAGVQFITLRPALFEFTCYSNGQIGNITLKQSSGNAIYDHVQVIALMQATPMPPFPAGTRRTSITLLQGWESHVRKPGEGDYIPGSFGQNFPTEKVREWVTAR